jgi:hypothetical protein
MVANVAAEPWVVLSKGAEAGRRVAPHDQAISQRLTRRKIRAKLFPRSTPGIGVLAHNDRGHKMLNDNLRRVFDPLLSREAMIACALLGAALLASIMSWAP